MAELIQLQVVDLPEVLIVGKAIEGDMATDNDFPAFWGRCFEENVFEPLEAQSEFLYDDGYVGWMGDWTENGGRFAYICGLMMKPGCAVPEGYAARTIPAGRVAIGWIKDVEGPELFQSAHPLTEEALKAQGHRCGGMAWCMEVYDCPRFTEPDENGNVILDYYIPLDE